MDVVSRLQAAASAHPPGWLESIAEGILGVGGGGINRESSVPAGGAGPGRRSEGSSGSRRRRAGGSTSSSRRRSRPRATDAARSADQERQGTGEAEQTGGRWRGTAGPTAAQQQGQGLGSPGRVPGATPAAEAAGCVSIVPAAMQESQNTWAAPSCFRGPSQRPPGSGMPSEAPVEKTQIPGSSSQMPVGEEGGRRPTRRTRPPERLSMELPVRGQQRRARSPSREQGPGGSRRRRPMAVSTPRQPGTRSGLQGQSHQQDTQGRARQANRTRDRRAISQHSHGSQEETGDEHAEDGRWSQGTRGPSFRDADSGGEEDSRSTAAGGRMTPARPGQVPIVIWILGHSYVYWGAQRADRRTGGRQLGMARNGAVIRWLGYRGLTWGRVLHEFFRAVNLYGVPDILVLHAGGNDLGAISGKGLSAKIRTDIRQLGLAFPNLRLVWSDMVPRKNWRGARSVKKINKARITVNKEVSKFVSRNGGVTIRHAGLDSTEGDYWLGDGVHLNTAGTDLWIEGLLGGMRKATAGLVGGVSST